MDREKAVDKIAGGSSDAELIMPKAYRRLVVKLGTNVLTAGTDGLNLEVMAGIVGQVARLHEEGFEVIIVSSGAIAAGLNRLGLNRERRDIPFRQVLAAVGQSRLMDAYDQLFSWHGITVAQTLLTKADLTDRLGYLNARNTLLALLDLGVVSIVHENDVVAVDELEGTTFGDNDNLSAMVANLVDADLLVLLTDTDGLFTADPGLDSKAELIPQVEQIDASIETLAGDSRSSRGIGGMSTKIEAAKLATASGTAVIIANGRKRDILYRLASGEEIGTLFLPQQSHVESRRRWILSGLAVKGKVLVDAGAVEALKGGKGSLLPAGVVNVEGEFVRGDAVEVLGPDGEAVASGIVNYSSDDLAKIRGLHSDRIAQKLGYQYGAEVMHRNNLVVL
jgi:glutamate 5-kinase